MKIRRTGVGPLMSIQSNSAGAARLPCRRAADGSKAVWPTAPLRLREFHELAFVSLAANLKCGAQLDLPRGRRKMGANQKLIDDDQFGSASGLRQLEEICVRRMARCQRA
jgi:hypothetical protein